MSLDSTLRRPPDECPAWCQERSGHQWKPGRDGNGVPYVERYHAALLVNGSGVVEVSVEEEVDSEGEHSVDEPSFSFTPWPTYPDGPSVQWDAAGLRGAAQLLISAAEALEAQQAWHTAMAAKHAHGEADS